MTDVPGERIEFPDGFVWGTAAAAHQVEGGNWNNDWWAWEHDPTSPCEEPSGDACDHYHRYADDLAMLGRMGHAANRFSIEWARVEPEPGEFSTAALDHYARVVDACHDAGMTPFVTLHHFTSPRWFAAAGGWAADDAAERFGRYSEVVARRLGATIPFVCTINEPNIVATMGYRYGVFPPGLRQPDLVAPVTRNFIAAHAASVRAFGEHAPSTSVGITLSTTDWQAVDEASVPTRDRIHRINTGVYWDAMRDGTITGIGHDEEIEGLAGASGFVGVQYYSRARVSKDASPRMLPPPPGAETTQMGYEVYPEGLVTVLREAAATGLPVYITENGIGTDDDRQRVAYIARHLAKAREAIDAGVDLRGYFYWSFMDNFEWTYGFSKTFGLIACDRTTFARTPKPSAHYYAEICRTNAVDPSVTRAYLEGEAP